MAASSAGQEKSYVNRKTGAGKSQNFEILAGELKQDIFRKVYLFYGKEEYLKHYYLDLIRKKLVSDEMRQMDEFIHEGKADPARILDMIGTPAFSGGKRVVILRDTRFFSKGGADTDLTDVVDNVDDNACLIFVEGEADKRLKNTKAVIEAGMAVEFAEQSEYDLAKWVIRVARSFGKKLNDKDAGLLIHYCEPDMNAILNETSKLAAYTGERDSITAEDIMKASARSLKSRIFDLTDALSSSDMAGAYKVLDELLVMKEPIQIIFFMIAKHYRQILQMAVYMDEGFSRKECRDIMGIHPYTAEKLGNYCGRFSREKLKSIIYRCLDYELAVKTGLMESRMAAEMIIAESGDYSGK